MVTAFRKVPGVLDAQANFNAKTATVTYDPSLVKLDKLAHALDGTPYKVAQTP